MHNHRILRGKLLIVALLALLLAIVATFGTATADAATLSPQSHLISRSSLVSFVPNVTCSTSDNQSIYAWYYSFKGYIPLRVGYQNTPQNRGYGYCHIQTKHPDALNKIAYIFQYGHLVATSSTSFTVRGTWPTGQQYQIYIVTSNNGMADGQMRGIVSAYPYPGTD